MKKYLVVFLVLVSISMFTIGCRNLRKVPPTIVTGQIVDENGVTLAGATVTLEGYDCSTVTDENGIFELSGVYGGIYRLQYGLGDYMGTATITIAGEPVNLGKLGNVPLFEDDFTAASSDWILSNGAVLSDGQLVLPDGAKAGLKVHTGDMRLRFELIPPGDSDPNKTLMVNLHNTDAEGMWPLDTRAGYTIWQKGNGGATFLKPTADGNPQWLLTGDWILWTPSSVSAPIVVDIMKSQGPSSESTTIQIKINGSLVQECTTPGLGVVRNEGYVGFHSCSGGTWIIDNLKLWELK